MCVFQNYSNYTLPAFVNDFNLVLCQFWFCMTRSISPFGIWQTIKKDCLNFISVEYFK